MKASISVYSIVLVALIFMLLFFTVGIFMGWIGGTKEYVASTGCGSKQFNFCVSWQKQPNEFDSPPPQVDPDTFSDECEQPSVTKCKNLVKIS